MGSTGPVPDEAGPGLYVCTLRLRRSLLCLLLSQLDMHVCADNLLSGTLDPVAVLTSLQSLDLAGNQLSGSLGAGLLAAMPQLAALKLVRSHAEQQNLIPCP